MNIDYFKNKKITVFGLGLLGGGLGVVKFLAKHGARKIIITDIKTKQELKKTVSKLKGIQNIELVLGYHRIEDFTKVDMVIKNPGISWDNKYIKKALDKKIPVEMDSSLFFKLCKNKIIGVTGTKGKTTTASMIFDILKNSGKKPIMIGVGQTSVLDRLEDLKKNSPVIFELSSWRLSALGRAKLSPNIAVFKNILPDHLNYYKGMDEYFDDKKNIFRFQKSTDWLIINNDDEMLKNIIPEVKSQIMRFSMKEQKGGMSVFYKNGIIYLDDGIDVRKLITTKELKLYCSHNIANVLAAIGVVFVYGLKLNEIKKAVSKINLISHRMEFVNKINDIDYYNDSAATIPQAAIAAINSFNKPIILIAGGADKNLNFSELGKVIAEKVKGVVFLKGEATEKLIKEIKKNMPERDYAKFEIKDSMSKAVEEATRCAEAGDIILLSPGTASFGVFANEFDRGDKFKETVKSLK
ncbi:MAG TPA: UDP-N-acetylmuramoyl-L-alanine--D-glutamate ligase [Candidatus Moranbacteria bacterium]|nr:UDP-N-acetylmuramoyl-L-alanine--D-glutamate ligase [Candidatus Moranbacteria bacterium]